MVASVPKPEGQRTITIRPMSVFTGAEIFGVDLKQPPSPETALEIRAALNQWKVVFFRNQHLDHAQHVALARALGQPTIGHVLYGHEPGFPEIYSVAKRRERHTHLEPDPIRP